MRTLPDKLPAAAIFDWTTRLPGEGVGGLAAAEEIVVAGCRDESDSRDLFFGCDAVTGEVLWELSYPAPGRLDYGASPRATPLIHDGRVYTFGAFGHARCCDAFTGEILWEHDLAASFDIPRLEWGLTGSPLLVDGRLILQPGGGRGCLAALDPDTGQELWRSPGALPGHSSLIVAPGPPGGQVIGYDQLSLGGWRLSDGARLWRIKPPLSGDFNVPTPLLLENRLVAVTENNGVRVYKLSPTGVPAPEPAAEYAELSPDTQSPVAIGRRVYGSASGRLHCLDVDQGLAPQWVLDDPAFHDYGSLIAARDAPRLLMLTKTGELLLIEDAGTTGRILARLQLREDRIETLSHPALAGRTLYVRLGRDLCALPLWGHE